MTLKDAVTKTEQKMIQDALENSGQDQMKAAVALGIHVTTLWRKRQVYGL